MPPRCPVPSGSMPGRPELMWHSRIVSCVWISSAGDIIKGITRTNDVNGHGSRRGRLMELLGEVSPPPLLLL